MNYFSEEAYRAVCGTVQIEDVDFEYSVDYDPRNMSLKHINLVAGSATTGIPCRGSTVWYEFDFEGCCVESFIGKNITENHRYFMHWLFANVIDSLGIDISNKNREMILNFKEA